MQIVTQAVWLLFCDLYGSFELRIAVVASWRKAWKSIAAAQNIVMQARRLADTPYWDGNVSLQILKMCDQIRCRTF